MDRRSFVRQAGLAAGVSAALTIAKPAIAQARKEMIILSNWPRDFPGLGTGAQRLAANIERLTEGRVKVRYFAAGENDSNSESIFDLVVSGRAHAYHATNNFWKDKHPGWSVFSSIPFGLTFNEMNTWLNFLDGQKLWDELANQFELKCLMAGSTGVQMGGWFKKEIKSADDLQGLIVFSSGVGGELFSKVGATPVSIAAENLLVSLQKGEIDVVEWQGPWLDYFMKFYEASKFYYQPGINKSGSNLSLCMNASWWGGLSKSDQEIIKAACSRENELMFSEFNANNSKFVKKLTKEHGVQIRKFGEDVYDKFGKAADEVLETARGHGDLAKRIIDSFISVRSDVGRWMDISEKQYYEQRNRILRI